MSKNKLALTVALLTTFIALPAFAAEGGSSEWDMKAMAMLGSGLAIGLAVLGGGMGQGRAAAAALEGISRNPGAASRIQTPMLIGLALIESLVLFALVIAYFLQNK